MCNCKEIKQRLSAELDILTEYSHTSYTLTGCSCKGIQVHLYNDLNENNAMVKITEFDDFDKIKIILSKILDTIYVG